MAGVLFEDIFDVKDIDPEGKKFDRGELSNNYANNLDVCLLTEKFKGNLAQIKRNVKAGQRQGFDFTCATQQKNSEGVGPCFTQCFGQIPTNVAKLDGEIGFEEDHCKEGQKEHP